MIPVLHKIRFYLEITLGDEDDEDEIVLSSKADEKLVITPKWPTRVFAMECIRMILDVCKDHQEHMDLGLARKLKEINSNGNVLRSFWK